MKPDLGAYDAIVLNSSGGKDSQAMLDEVAGLARAAGVVDRMLVVHADLGRVEWRGTRELAERQAAHYGVPFIAVTRSQGDLLEHALALGFWPRPGSRWCTSDHKRGQILPVLTRVARTARVPGRPTRILQCLGMRAEESPGRAKMPLLSLDPRASNSRRVVDRWLPIHEWTVDEVWRRIRASGCPHHFAYDLGMPRLSCVFCIYASEDALLLAAEHNRELAYEYVAVEKKIGHDFKHHLPMARVVERLERGERTTGPVRTWCM